LFFALETHRPRIAILRLGGIHTLKIFNREDEKGEEEALVRWAN
jgi:hypothetical protein